MPGPQLTFYSEIGKEDISRVFSDKTLELLKKMDAGVSLAILDQSEERASLITRLNNEEIPVTAWLLLPKEKGYWFNIGNYEYAAQLYSEFFLWSSDKKLTWQRIGLDFEPDIEEWDLLFFNRWGWMEKTVSRLLNRSELKKATIAYSKLIDQIQSDGYEVETYHFPLISDERKSKSKLLQKISGIVDVFADREVWMMYSNVLRPNGAGFLVSYAPEAEIIALGSTGGGIDNVLYDVQPLNWQELERDLRLAWLWCDELYIFSLEGCIQQDFLEKLLNFTWDKPILLPTEQANRVNGWRSTFRTGLWILSHPVYIILGLLAFYTFFKIFKRTLKS
jgi:hypothetical protein